MYMIMRKNILLERIDFHQIATQIVKNAGLKSKVKYTNTGNNKADYNVDNDRVLRLYAKLMNHTSEEIPYED